MLPATWGYISPATLLCCRHTHTRHRRRSIISYISGRSTHIQIIGPRPSSRLSHFNHSTHRRTDVVCGFAICRHSRRTWQAAAIKCSSLWVSSRRGRWYDYSIIDKPVSCSFVCLWSWLPNVAAGVDSKSNATDIYSCIPHVLVLPFTLSSSQGNVLDKYTCVWNTPAYDDIHSPTLHMAQKEGGMRFNCRYSFVDTNLLCRKVAPANFLLYMTKAWQYYHLLSMPIRKKGLYCNILYIIQKIGCSRW